MNAVFATADSICSLAIDLRPVAMGKARAQGQSKKAPRHASNKATATSSSRPCPNIPLRDAASEKLLVNLSTR